MSETAEHTAVEVNAFDDSAWGEQKPIVAPAPEAGAPEITTQEAPSKENQAQQPPQTIDYNSYVKEKFGYDSEEVALQEIEKLKNQKPEPYKYANEESEKLATYLNEGKIEEVYKILDKKVRVDRLTATEVNDLNVAAEIIKMGMQNRYKDLSAEDIEYKFNKQFAVPSKPVQREDELDEDYSSRVSDWQTRVKDIEREILIEAKVTKPELEKLKSELVLPNIEKAPVVPQKSQEELDEIERTNREFSRKLESEYNNFNGYSVTVKDEDVEVTTSYVPTLEEKSALKNGLNDLFANNYFARRWFTEDGQPKITDIMSDKYVLENLPKILQKVANDSVQQYKEKSIELRGNISLNKDPQGTFKPDDKSEKQKEEDAIWSA